MTLRGWLNRKDIFGYNTEIYNPKKKETTLDKLKEFIYDGLVNICEFIDIINPYYPIRRMINHGFFLKNWRISIKTLPADGWRDKDSLMLHANFQILTDYVEEECSKMNDFPTHLDSSKKIKDKKIRGLIYLEKYINLNESGNYPMPEVSTAYKEIRSLYIWWNVERPSRTNPDDDIESYISHDNLMDFWGKDSKEKAIFLKKNPKFKKEYAEWGERCDLSQELEDKYKKEDDKMLLRLIKVRSYMWS